MLAAFLLGLFGFILLNIPIAFALILTTVVLMLLLTGDVSTPIIAQSVIRGVDSFPLMAIPFFILAGEIMNEGGISRRIVEFARALVGHVTGGLGYVGVVASMLFAGVSGSAVADTSAIGSILLPMMDKEGYKKASSASLIAAAGTIGPVIPPSIPMILFGVIGGVSVVKMFLGGIVPGILIGIGLMVVWYFHSKKQGYKSNNKSTLGDVGRAGKSAFWALILPIIILGGIITGIYTPTEAGVIAVVYSLFVGKFAYKELKLTRMPRILTASAKSTAIVLLLCGAAMSAAYLITTAQIPSLLTGTLIALSNDNVYLVMFFINILLLLVGMVMDLTPALLILGPMLLPIATGFGLDPVYFGVVMVVNLCIGLITPPVGTVLYVVCGISKLSMGDLVRPVLPFVAVMIVVLGLITYIPELITFIPNLVAR
ncbi:TRAP transporter large permease [Desulfosporosinus sp. BICA1-9]|uniref:TRAP transporter large permease n=1 Tax=Desulfosporosinus sp. BICA1-9 TaxID=1531958 RepID=UPI00061F2EFA|nr:TRAP transporter large permease [Desulfosporosinus sp. BICA1-9]KJS50223.1 MAG: L-dehydroascorbate transporter large permease subunit [Peptococcaceae bacterium BRH_c23]